LENVVAILRAAGEPSRLRALALLAKGELAVGELAQALQQSQPRISRHMKVLTDCGLAERAPEGAWVFYRLAAEGRLERSIADALVASLDPEDPALRQDDERLGDVRQARAAAAAAYFAANAQDWERVRALHLPEGDVEAAMIRAAGEGPFELMIDVGSGAGRMLAVFADRVRHAEGFDISPQMLAVARSALAALPPGKAAVRQGDVYAPPFAPGSADLVTVHQVLHFLPDPGRAVAEAAKLLRPGGRIVIADFAPHGLEFLRERHAHRRLGFSDGEIEGWCAAAGVAPGGVITLSPTRAEAEALTVKVWSGAKIAPNAELGT
jgi:ArsR family transcriptional regulator